MSETFLNKAQLTGLGRDARRTEILRARATSPTPWTAVTFQNSWANFSASRQGVEYRKVGDMVQLRGEAAGGTNNSTAFTLPVGFRIPKDDVIAIGSSSGVPNDAFLFVQSNGDVAIYTASTTDVHMTCQFSVTA